MYIKKSASKKMAMMVLIIAFVFNSAPVRVAGATAGDFTITLTEGGTIVQDSAANGGHYTFSGGVLTILSNNNYTISMTKNTTANRIVVASDATITLSNVKIDVSSVNASNANCAFSISDDSDVQLILSGDNILKSGVNSAGLSVHETSSVTISGEGSLLAESRNYGAGIGSGRAAKSGSITIDDGTITAKGGSEAAGIGGGQNASSGAITINSGFVTATSGSSTTNAIGAGKSGTSDGVTIDDNFVYWLSDEDYLSIPPENAAENSDLSSEIEGYVKLNYAVQQIGFETNIASGASLLMVSGDTPEEYKYDDPTLSVKGDESSGGVKYRWYRSNTLGGPWVFIPDDADGSAYVIPANTPVGDYYYRCVVYSEVGKPVTSNAAHVKVRPTSYRVWFKVDDETPYGTVSAALDSAEQHTSGDLVTQGDAITFTAKPNDANEVYVKQWADDNGPISNATGNTYRIAALSSDVTITVSFAKKTYEVKVTDIDDSASDTKGSGFYPKGDTVSISYAEPHGKRFLGWEVATTSPAGAIVQLQNPGSKNTTFSMPSADVTIKADYEDVYELTYETNNGNISATVDGTLLVKDPATGKAKVSYDKEIVFNVGNYNNPNDALRVIWSVEPMDRTERPKIVAVDEYTYTHPKITSDMALRVNFTERTYSVKVENVKVENVVEETLISAKDPEYVKENSTVTISAEDPKTLPGGLEFIRWDAYRQNSDGSRGAQILGQDFENLKIVNEKLPTTDFTMPGYDVIFVAIFKPYETKVTSVTVVPETAEVPAGGSFSFRANIRGSGNVGGVTW
ncbi:MAG: hypothetical protein LBR83_08535, partial [Clostridiales bacterium]|nr:hypothetical protein [Clostridiales bacterium]